MGFLIKAPTGVVGVMGTSAWAGVVGTSAWAGVYVTQVCFYTNVHICDTLAARCAHMCICIYVCICMYMHMDAYVRL